jgi:hypothetical protein
MSNTDNLQSIAKEYLGYGLSIIPTKEDKLPAVYSWETFQGKALSPLELEDLFKGQIIRPEIEREITKKDGTKFTARGVKLSPDPKGIAIICGAISGGLEVIDVDTKHDTTGSLWEELKGLIEDNLPELYSRLVIAQTRSGGYHIYYRCSQIKGNLKLAIKLNREVLIETRGEGGYVVAPPSEGYRYLHTQPGEIPTITPEEREILFSIARSFTELPEEEPKKINTSPRSQDKEPGNSPFEDYNHRGDVVALLESRGWRIVDQRGQRVNLLRPGTTDSKTSGNFHTGIRVLRVFSSSTEFSPDKGYSPSQVFSLLECGGDNKTAYRKLLDQGYGEPFKGDIKEALQIKTERIKAEVVNQVNRETSVISSPGETLRKEDIEAATGEGVVITSPGPEATEEVLKALQIAEATGKRVYVKEGEEPEVRSFIYRLQAILNKYGAIEEERGELTDKEIDSLLDEVVEAGSRLQEPIDRDRYKKLFIEHEGIKALGITEESLSITVDRLTSTREKEAQAKEFKKLLSEVTALQEKGEVGKALELLGNQVKEVKLRDKATEFSSLLLPIKEAELRARISHKPESLNSGYSIDTEELLLPSGAISIFTAPTSHGKTTFLINLALNIAQAYPDKEAYFFSYEEDADSILINALNTYMDKDISANNRRSLKTFFATGSTEYMRGQEKGAFSAVKESFFKELVDTRRLNINYTSYNSDTLIEAIRYLHKNAKPAAIFIDYIQLLNLPEGKYKTYSRQEEIKEICIALKDVAVETGLPIILGAQFNREVTNQLKLHATKIGEAGDIERIANLIVGFWNNNFKPLATEGELREINSKGGSTPDSLYTVILKNRGGRVGMEEILSYNGNTGKIKNHSTSRWG